MSKLSQTKKRRPDWQKEKLASGGLAAHLGSHELVHSQEKGGEQHSDANRTNANDPDAAHALSPAETFGVVAFRVDYVVKTLRHEPGRNEDFEQKLHRDALHKAC